MWSTLLYLHQAWLYWLCYQAAPYLCYIVCVGEWRAISLDWLLFNTLRPSDPSMSQWTDQHWFRQWLVAWTAPSHYLNQCWNIVNWTPINKLQWNFDWNFNIFIQGNAFESTMCEMAAMLFRPQYVNTLRLKHFVDNICWCVFLNGSICVLLCTSPKLVPCFLSLALQQEKG